MTLEADQLDNLYGVAIVGMGCRFPKAKDPAAFWRNISQGLDCVTRFSDQELARAGVPVEILRNPDYIKAGSILENVEGFDAGFFGMSPAEAELADPQLRVFLECAWEALESAGCDPEAFKGVIGVYCGMSMSAYLLHNLYPTLGFTQADSLTALLLNDKDYLASQTAYRFNLTGPAISVQTACSTSLTAVYTACSSLLNGECDMALAGGVTIRVPQMRGYYHRRGGIASPDGHTRAFDAEAAGTVFGNGAGVVALKRLRDALDDGDLIDAVILGGALNNDGSLKVGFAAPSVDGQAEAISEAVNIAGVSAEDIGLVEAHGTATPLGDPIELAALTQAFRQTTAKRQFCALGSVKSNVGHLECAAGMAGLIKTVMALQNRALPPTLHYRQPNPQFSFADSPFYVNTELRDWPAGPKPRRAGVSSFGIGGTNVHLTLEESPARPPAEPSPATSGLILPLSARSVGALRDLARSISVDLARCESADDASLYDFCFSAGARRAHHPVRLALAARDAGTMRKQLQAFLAGEMAEGLALECEPGEREPRVAFVFPGQGSQWPGMGRGLFREEPLFREAIERCERAIAPFVDWSLTERLFDDGDTVRFDDVAVVQPMIFALQAALASMWRAYGVEPVAVVGHSMGEIAAAYTAGALSLEDAARIACLRSQLVKRSRGEGAMALIALEFEQVERDLAPFGGRLSVAALNGPATTLVSGEPTALEEAMARWRERDVFCRLINVDYASHCSQMDALLPELRETLSQIKPKKAKLPILSSVFGRNAEGPELDDEYWATNLRQRALFLPAVKKLLEQGVDLFIEISPHPVLLPSIRETVHAVKARAATLPTLQRDRDERLSFLESFAALYCSGYAVDWRAVYREGGRYVRLPGYPWQRQSHWIGGQGVGYDLNLKTRFDGAGSPTEEHPLLGAHFASSLQRGVHFWQTKTTPHSPLHVFLPRYGQTAAVDGMALVALTYTAVRLVRPQASFGLRGLRFPEPLFLTGSRRAPALQLAFSQVDDEWSTVRASSQGEAGPAADNEDWARHMDGELVFDNASPTPGELPEEIVDRLEGRREGAEVYRALRKHGVNMEQRAQAISRLWCNLDEAMAELALPDQVTRGEGALAALQACVHAALALALNGGGRSSEATVFTPRAIKTMRFSSGGGRPKWAHVRLGLMSRRAEGIDKVELDFFIYDQSGQTLASASGLELRPLTAQTRRALLSLSDDCYGIRWAPAEIPSDRLADPTGASRALLVFTHDALMSRRVTAALTAGVEGAILVEPGDGFDRSAPDRFTVRPDAAEDFDALFRALEDDAPRGAPEAMVYLWGLADGPCNDLAALRERQALACGGLIRLTQAFVRREQDPVPRLWLVSAGLHCVDSEPMPLLIDQAPLWGVGKNIVQEHPELRCSMVDLSAAPAGVELEALRRELTGAAQANEIALRGERRYTALLGRCAFNASLSVRSADQPLCRGNAAYLVSGGLGGIGLALAEWLVEQGARHLALFSRNEPSSRAQAVLDGLARKVDQLAVFQTDVADEAGLTAMFRHIDETMPPLAGVFHLAADMEDNVLLLLDWTRFRKASASKIDGAWNLHRLTLDRKLDHFVLFSSVVSLLGSHGQAGYTAGNRFLDALAHHRRGLGLPALSVNWGAWGGIGRAAESRHDERLAGLVRFDPEAGFEALRRFMREGVVQAGFIHGLDLGQWFKRHPKSLNLPFFRNFRGEATMAVAPRVDAVRDELENAATESAKRALLASFLRRAAGLALKLPSDRIEPDKPLAGLGLNSLLGLDFRRMVEDGLGLELPATLVYNYPTIAELTGFLAAKLGLADADRRKIAEKPAAKAAFDDELALASLSEEEAASLLMEKLDAFEQSD